MDKREEHSRQPEQVQRPCGRYWHHTEGLELRKPKEGEEVQEVMRGRGGRAPDHAGPCGA